MDDIFTAIMALLGQVFDSDYPEINTGSFQGRPIVQGYQNNFTIPATGKYVIITSRSDTNMSLKWEPSYDSTTQQNTYATLMSTPFMIDMYGDNSEDNARILSAICQNGFTNQFWLINNYACRVHKVRAPRNLSDIFGREMYNQRWQTEIEIFNNVATTLSVPNFTEIDFKLTWVNNKKT